MFSTNKHKRIFEVFQKPKTLSQSVFNCKLATEYLFKRLGWGEKKVCGVLQQKRVASSESVCLGVKETPIVFLSHEDIVL